MRTPVSQLICYVTDFLSVQRVIALDNLEFHDSLATVA